VDVGHFSKALDPQTKVPQDVKEISKPIVGFFGLIEEWLDQELIKKIAVDKPDWSIVLIGKINVDVAGFKSFKNIHVLGPRNYQDLPAYCKAFDVAIIPFVINELTKNVNPIKLREYLAAGVPVVSSRLPEVEKYSEYAFIADNHQEFVKYLEKAIENDSNELKNKRREFIKKESWLAKIEEISSIIQKN
jgi:glycosyltransferase involved in cell wall biosynthesis